MLSAIVGILLQKNRGMTHGFLRHGCCEEGGSLYGWEGDERGGGEGKGSLRGWGWRAGEAWMTKSAVLSVVDPDPY